MHLFNIRIILIIFVLAGFVSTAQEEWLIIGRTTGALSFNKTDTIRCFGFSNSLSGQITLPGVPIEVYQGDTVAIDFWNISQGRPHSLSIKGLEISQKNQRQIYTTEKEEVHHMNHGFYKFHATELGTYIYYSSENTSFYLQAGMFGLVIVRPKEQNETTQKLREVIWCSHEIDTSWHSDYLMDFEDEFRGAKVDYPRYKPDYYLINGQTIKLNKGLGFDPPTDSSKVILRLANTGAFNNLITFPENVSVTYLSGNSTSLTSDKKGAQIHLETLESIDVLVSVKSYSRKSRIVYSYIEPSSGKTKHKSKLPLFFEPLNQ